MIISDVCLFFISVSVALLVCAEVATNTHYHSSRCGHGFQSSGPSVSFVYTRRNSLEIY